MALKDLKWYRLKFHDSFAQFDTPNNSGPDKPDKVNICAELFKSGVKTLFADTPGLVEIVTNLNKKGHIQSIKMRADSIYFGNGITRCAYIFPSEVFIPTHHDLHNGVIIRDRQNGLVTYHGETFLADIHIKLGISQVNPDDLRILRQFNSSQFVGIMDEPISAPPK